MSRGELYWADLGPASSSVPAKRRPVVIVQADSFNRSLLATVTIAAVTSNTAVAGYPGNLFLPSAVTGLPRDSVVNVTALATIDRDGLGERICVLPGYLLSDLDAGLRLALGL